MSRIKNYIQNITKNFKFNFAKIILEINKHKQTNNAILNKN